MGDIESETCHVFFEYIGLRSPFLLTQHRNDLLLAGSGLLHVRPLTKLDSGSNWQGFRGHVTIIRDCSSSPSILELYRWKLMQLNA